MAEVGLSGRYWGDWDKSGNIGSGRYSFVIYSQVEKYFSINLVTGEPQKTRFGETADLLETAKRQVDELEAENERLKKEVSCDGCPFLEADGKIINQHIEKNIIFEKQLQIQDKQIAELQAENERLKKEKDNH
ncbi:MAG: hypothetical protein ABII09_03705 [Planctomycetota bacterium]